VIRLSNRVVSSFAEAKTSVHKLTSLTIFYTVKQVWVYLKNEMHILSILMLDIIITDLIFCNDIDGLLK
jgi:hypothetical protein